MITISISIEEFGKQCFDIKNYEQYSSVVHYQGVLPPVKKTYFN
jgi:hypothetical protein